MNKPPISKTICVLPWLHLNIIPSGKVIHCCMTSDMSHELGDLAEQSLEEIWNSDNMRAIRRQMLAGEKPKVCSRCYEKEESSGVSHRLHFNRDFLPKVFEIPRITTQSGHVDKIDLKYWDFRFSNLCNFRCRVCGPESSSAWVPDAKKLGWLNDQDARKLLRVESVEAVPKIDFVKRYLHQVERIYFAGGEPLLMDEHWQILDILDAQQRYDVKITYNTNLSTLSYKNKSVLEYWPKWGRKISVCPSIDELDERAELIRSGTVWKNVEANLLAIGGLGVRLRPNITVSALNVFRLPEIIDRLLELGVIKEDREHFINFTLNVVEEPQWCHVSILPLETRRTVKERLIRYISDFQEKYRADISAHFKHLLWHLERDWNKANLDVFKNISRQMDVLRNEKTADIIPELKAFLE
ncbi:twitch domain-containing radical SAM protein [Methylomagnum sp.]